MTSSKKLSENPTLKRVRKASEWRKSSGKVEYLERITNPDLEFNGDEFLNAFDGDVEFFISCLRVCLRTNQFEEKFKSIFDLVESKISITPNLLRMFYDQSFILCIDLSEMSALEYLLQKAKSSTIQQIQKPNINNEGLVKACEKNDFRSVSLFVSYGYRLKSFHKERLRQLRAHPLLAFPRQDQVTLSQVVSDEVGVLHMFRLLSTPAYIISCYTSVTARAIEKFENNSLDYCSCQVNAPEKNSMGIRSTRAVIEAVESQEDQPDTRPGLQDVMSQSIHHGEIHLCPANKAFRPSEECAIHPECNDPIFRCFDLAKSASKLAKRNPEYNTEFSDIAKHCRDLSVQLLNQCTSTDEVQVLLSESWGSSKYFRFTQAIKYPRLRLAIEHHYKDFVGHMYCQQMLRQEWHAGIPWQGQPLKYKVLYTIAMNLFIPVFLFHWMFTQIGRDIQYLRSTELPNEREIEKKHCVGRYYFRYLKYCNTTETKLDLPLNRFIIFSGYYLVYLVFVIFAIEEPVHYAEDEINTCEKYHAFNRFHFALSLYAFSMLWQDFKIIIFLRSVMPIFRNFWRAFDLLMHMTLSGALLSRLIASSLDCCEEGITDCTQVYASKASTILLSVAATVSIVRLIYWFLLHDIIGPVVINMARAILDILTIAMTYVFVLIAFASGIVFIVGERNKYFARYHPDTHNVTDIGYTKMMVNLLWSFFDPQKPDIFGDDSTDDDVYAAIGYTLYAAYLLLIVVVLLNLLIAIMNATVQKVYDKKQLYWKFSRTSVWIEFFDDELSSPPVPFSIFQIIWSITFGFLSAFVFLTRKFFSKKNSENGLSSNCVYNKERQEARILHAKLMLALVDRYIEKLNVAVIDLPQKSRLPDVPSINIRESGRTKVHLPILSTCDTTEL